MPAGCGIVRIPAENKAGCAPVPCCYALELLNFTVSPKSFEPLLGKNCGGHLLRCDKENESFKFVLDHKLRRSESTAVVGDAMNGLCYAKPAIMPEPRAKITAAMTLQEADRSSISKVEDHPANSVTREIVVHKLSMKQQRPLWHQRLGHCGDEQLC